MHPVFAAIEVDAVGAYSNRNCLGQFRKIPWNQTNAWFDSRIVTDFPEASSTMMNSKGLRTEPLFTLNFDTDVAQRIGIPSLD